MISDRSPEYWLQVALLVIGFDGRDANLGKIKHHPSEEKTRSDLSSFHLLGIDLSPLLIKPKLLLCVVKLQQKGPPSDDSRSSWQEVPVKKFNT